MEQASLLEDTGVCSAGMVMAVFETLLHELAFLLLCVEGRPGVARLAHLAGEKGRRRYRRWSRSARYRLPVSTSLLADCVVDVGTTGWSPMRRRGMIVTLPWKASQVTDVT